MSGFAERATSDYFFPYLSGFEFVVGLKNCNNGSLAFNSEQAYVYDFDMPIGTSVIVALEGLGAVVVEQHSETNNTAGQESYFLVQHDDGSISGYYNLTKNGANVEVGDLVIRGTIIGLSGNTGDSSAPHLHFEVAFFEDCETIPENFNTMRKYSVVFFRR